MIVLRVDLPRSPSFPRLFHYFLRLEFKTRACTNTSNTVTSCKDCDGRRPLCIYSLWILISYGRCDFTRTRMCVKWSHASFTSCQLFVVRERFFFFFPPNILCSDRGANEVVRWESKKNKKGLKYLFSLRFFPPLYSFPSIPTKFDLLQSQHEIVQPSGTKEPRRYAWRMVRRRNGARRKEEKKPSEIKKKKIPVYISFFITTNDDFRS